jgi:regulator of nucleoside diphosphate kinase
MMDGKILISEDDRTRLMEMLVQSRRQGYRGSEYLRNLQGKLDQAQIVSPEEVPEDAVRMGSTVRLLDLDTQKEVTWTLVFPGEADLDEQKISVLAPLGTAIFGQHIGDTFEWEVPNGNRRLEVLEVTQGANPHNPNSVADAVGGMQEKPYPERRRPLEDELAADEDTAKEIQSKWAGGYPYEENKNE